jgi:tetratricopeptide (TPR) repeat protein
MMLARRNAVAGMKLAVLLFAMSTTCGYGQTNLERPGIDEPTQVLSPVASLDLTPQAVLQLNNAVADHNYIAAEKLLLEEIEADRHSLRAARLLAYLGSIYFLNHDYLNAAIAWKKSDAIRRLDTPLQFSLAMTYIHLGHSDWARAVLTTLANQSSNYALYPYWLGRLDYDAQHYSEAILSFQKAIQLAPKMARAYDNLGLCYFAQNQNDLAILNYRKAIELEKDLPHPAAWPYLNLAVVLQSVNQPEESEKNVREAIRIDPQLAQAHFRLGSLLEDRDRLEEAAIEFNEAVRIDDSYAEPHLALARIYKRLGKGIAAQREAQAYAHLHLESKTDSLLNQPVKR